MTNRPGTTRPALPRPFAAMLAAPLVLAIVAAAGAAPVKKCRLPDLDECSNLEVPEGHRLSSQLYAEGVQIYRWDGSAWIFVAPEALLFADDGGHGVVGIHYAGPTWESLSGSLTVGAVLERCTPDPDAIPWLLLRAVVSEGPGPFHQVTFIQRVNTVGGKAPAHPGSSPGELARVPYAADYNFYRAQP